MDLIERANELEAQATAIREELNGVLAELAKERGEDDFAMRFAQRMMDERDAALLRIAELESTLTERTNAAEARANAVTEDAVVMRRVIAQIINAPLLPRDQVQSRLILVNERVRDRDW